MIILSVGMPRAGTGWYYNLTNDLMLASGAKTHAQIRKRYHLQSILTEVNCNIGALTLRRLLAVLVPSLMGNTFVIKAHAAPTPFALNLIRRGLIRPTYIYRDPRDAMLSAMENGQRAIQRERPNAFSGLVEFDDALNFMLAQVNICQAWMACPEALHARYEDLLTHYENEAERLVSFLPVDRDKPDLTGVIEKYRPEMARTIKKAFTSARVKIGRFRQKMSATQQETLASAFSPHLGRMGYPL